FCWCGAGHCWWCGVLCPPVHLRAEARSLILGCVRKRCEAPRPKPGRFACPTPEEDRAADLARTRRRGYACGDGSGSFGTMNTPSAVPTARAKFSHMLEVISWPAASQPARSPRPARAADTNVFAV